MNPFVESWRELNGIGRAAAILMILLGISYFIPWAPLDVLHGTEPQVPHYIAIAILLMLNVPLVRTAWKVQRDRGGLRVFLVVIVLVTFLTLLRGRFTLERGHSLLPSSRTSMLLLWTLFVIVSGWGLRRPAHDSTLNSSKVTDAVRG